MKYCSKIVFLFAILFSSVESYGQSYYIAQIGNVVYSSYPSDKDSILKKHYATLLNRFIRLENSRNKNLIIYLTFKNNTKYAVAYDNLPGYCSQNSMYGESSRLNKVGIKLLLPLEGGGDENALKLLEYATNNIRELKKIRRKALHMTNFCDTDRSALFLSKSKIDAILNSNKSAKVNAILNGN